MSCWGFCGSMGFWDHYSKPPNPYICTTGAIVFFRILCRKSRTFSMAVGLCQGYVLSLLLFVSFMDRICLCSYFYRCDTDTILFFADLVVLLASSGLNLKHTQGQLSALSDVWIKISISISQDIVVCRKMVIAPDIWVCSAIWSGCLVVASLERYSILDPSNFAEIQGWIQNRHIPSALGKPQDSPESSWGCGWGEVCPGYFVYPLPQKLEQNNAKWMGGCVDIWLWNNQP